MLALVVGVTAGAVFALIAGARRTDSAYSRFLRTHAPADLLIGESSDFGITEKVDLDAIMQQVDIAAIVDRVDIPAIVDQIDIGGIVTEVLEEIDLRSIVRESTLGGAGELRDAVRGGAMRTDVAIEKIVDKVLRRRQPRSGLRPAF